MRFLLFAVLAIALACGCSPANDDSNASSSVSSSKSAVDPLQQPFSSGTDATAWLMDTKHTLRGLTADEARVLLEDLISGGAVEMKVDDIQPDTADPSFQSAGRMIVRAPRNSDERKALLEFAAQRNGDPAPTSFDREFLEIRFGR